MGLKFVDLNQANQRFLSVVYGPPGSGKTYSSGTLDGKTLIIDFDRGTSALPPNDNIKVFAPSSYEELISAMFELENSDFDNIILDTITKLQSVLVSGYTPPIQVKEWGIISSKLIKIIDKLDFLSTKGKNVIILAQEKILDEDTPAKMLSTVDILPSVRSNLTAAARVIARTYINGNDYKIAISKHAHRITKVSVFGVDTNDLNSFKELIERIGK